MSRQPLVSIVIPVYNGSNYLSEAIDSALAQTYPNVEVIVIDDGSSDKGATRAVADQFGKDIRYIFKPNGGVATALNVGIESMRGDLFSWLSHDDLYKPEKVARQVETWSRFGQPCVVIGDFETMDEQKNTISQISLSGRNLVARPLDAVFYGLINGCALLVPRALFDDAKFDPGLPTTQDYHLWYRIARSVPFVRCPHSDVRQRIHSLQGSRHASHLDEASRMFAHLIDDTPIRTMEAYDGSELRFLLKIRQALSVYPGLRSYLTSRIREQIRYLRYTAFVCFEGADDIDNAIKHLEGLAIPPAQIVTANLDAIGPVHNKQKNEDLKRNVLLARLDDTRVTDLISAAYGSTSTESVIFMRASHMPSEAQLRCALEEFVLTDADSMHPTGIPLSSSVLDGVIARRAALPLLGDALEGSGSKGSAIRKLQRREYAIVDRAPLLHTCEQLTDALRGEICIDYHRGFSEKVLADLLIGQLDPALPTIVVISHTLGGGTQTHLNSFLRALRGKTNCLTIYGSAGHLRVSLGSMTCERGLLFRVPAQLTDLVRILRTTTLKRLDVFHTIGFEAEAEMLIDALDLPFDVTLLDYHLLATHPHLCADKGTFAGDEELRDPSCNLLRAAPMPILLKASRIIAISRDLAARFDSLCPGLSIIPAQLWHQSAARVRHVFVPRLRDEECLRVLLVGAVSYHHKGRSIILEAAQIVAERRLPIRFHVMGSVDSLLSLRHNLSPILTLHGPFEEGKFSEMLSGIAPHVAWMPAQAPETWSYVMNDLMDAALPIAATALGAISERCYGRPATWLLRWNATAMSWVELFLRLHGSKLQEPPRWFPIDSLPPAQPFYFGEYLAPLAQTTEVLEEIPTSGEPSFLRCAVTL